jgi:hypothetical protein
MNGFRYNVESGIRVLVLLLVDMLRLWIGLRNDLGQSIVRVELVACVPLPSHSTLRNVL